ncbi:hypothetical protein BBD42_26540 [Paenibacillus sp. BIHB 4019]|uniref:Uncharacterized protein n=1 Tax=Paenibacillus sp. BIHB 4019 TaxID=1870819 RepID=A0A1B2DPL5_9BACL|nr:hypothetical protein [Paenibacillus sp. BIHB 4019]ANY69647.1 hypothetical protein BBD42_26540 [Paenibacillus sp. BIHB 4019]
MSNWQYIVLLGAVVVVFGLLLPRRKQPAAAQAVNNMEVSLEQFMENMEQDNRELTALIVQSQEEARAKAQRSEERLAELERKYSAMEQLFEQQKASAVPVQAAQVMPVKVDVPLTPVPAALQEEPEELEEPAPPVKQSIQERYADLFALHQQGKSIEAIAKKMNMNKGEVQLILQLAKQEEGARV